MFYCERCESRYNDTAASVSADCPRCREADAVASPLRFRLFEPSALRVAGLAAHGTARPPQQPAK